MSKDPNPAGTYPWDQAPRTCGPLGTNKDAADPGTPDYFLVDTPGSLGHGDGAASKIERCRKRYCFDRKILFNRKKVRDEIREVSRIRDGFADKRLLNEALQNNWSVHKYQQKVIEKVFGKLKPGGKPAINPMYLNPTTCTIHENWNLAMYRRQGLPDIIYYADRAHEAVHRKSCLAKTNPMVYNADMSFVDKLSREEVKAYDAKIKALRKWLRENDAGLEQWVIEYCR